MLYPLIFNPVFKERVWGGRSLERLYRKPLPAGMVVGESWEIADRPEAVSLIANGPLAGKSLRWLMETSERDVLGKALSPGGRFPVLLKILDARETLSVQVHPPARVAGELGGESKSELWYIAAACPGAELYAGLRRGVTRDEFTRGIEEGTVATCLHRLTVAPGDALFLPSGRVHALGAGIVVFEIQQNSDTTYRVFDWNRAGLDGRPRELQVERSLRCIDFEDYEPALVAAGLLERGGIHERTLVNNPLFCVREYRFPPRARTLVEPDCLTILGLLKGSLTVSHGTSVTKLTAGDFCLIPAALEHVALESEAGTSFLGVTLGGCGG